MLKRDNLGNLLSCDDKGLSGLKPYELVSSATQTVEDKTTGIKYIVGRWQTTGQVPSQIVRHPLPADTKAYPWQKSDFDLTDIPTKYEYRFRQQRDAIKRELNAKKRDAKKAEQTNVLPEDKPDTNTQVSE